MTAPGSPFECLFEGVDGGDQHEFAELAVLHMRVDSGPQPALDARKSNFGHPALTV